MADHIKATKDAIWRKKQELQKEQGLRDEWASMVPGIEASLAGLNPGDPEFEEWQFGLDDAKSNIANHDSTLEKLRKELAALEAELPQETKQVTPKFDPEKHPLLRKAVEKQEPEQAVVFSTGDMVEAQWTDRSWYKAKIQSVLGSASDPKYLVRFIEYDDSMTVDGRAVRALPSKRKREPETVAAPSLPVNTNPHVISGPASVNPNAQIARSNVDADEGEEPKKKSRIANKGQLKKRMSAWKDFQNKTAKKNPKKESMFRTSTDAGSKVGFTGSGKGMTETAKRTRYNHKADVELEEADMEKEKEREAAVQVRKYY